MNNIMFLMTLLLLVGCSEESQYSASEVNQIGEKLASWADFNNVTISIDDLPLNSVGANSGGCSPVYWDNPDKSADVVEHRENLSTLLDLSNCDKDQLILTVNAIENTTSKQDVVSGLECLGTATFHGVECGSD